MRYENSSINNVSYKKPTWKKWIKNTWWMNSTWQRKKILIWRTRHDWKITPRMEHAWLLSGAIMDTAEQKWVLKRATGLLQNGPPRCICLNALICFLDIDWIQLRKSPPLICFFDTEWWLKLLCEWGKHVKLNQSLDHNTEKAYSTETQSQQTSLRFAFSSPALSPSYPGEKPWRLPSLPLPGAKFQWKPQMPRCT